MKRKLSADETALWARLAKTVTPLKKAPSLSKTTETGSILTGSAKPTPTRRQASINPAAVIPAPPPSSKASSAIDRRTLDAGWDRKLARGVVSPDFTIDLHGHTLTSAHARLESGLTFAAMQNARLVLLITGRPRPSDDHASRGERRGAIRAKYLDWLSQGSHASRIAAIRPAHPRHGGHGAVYLILRRAR